jgi:alcohol dehydrogenase class IV
MVVPFQFSRLPQIYFGAGKISELTALIKVYGSSALLVTGRNSFINSEFSEELFSSFKKNCLTFSIIAISGEPSVENIDEAVSKFRNTKTDAVVAIGGGSVIDAGKAISAMIGKSESVLGYLEGVGNLNHTGTKLPFIAVPTTSGTGSEATKNAVISKVGRDGFKRSLRHDNFVPDVALVDPELTKSCSPEITAASGTDCFTQLTEAYLSTKSNPYTDALSLEGLKAIRSSLKESYIDGSNIEARTGMSFAALTSGICLANAGLGAVHGFASSIGGMYNIPHGLVCGTLIASANEVNVRELRKNKLNPAALNKYAILGRLFIEKKGKADDFYIDGFIEYLFEMTNYLMLPGLAQCGIREDDIELICSKIDIKNNPVKLSSEDLIEILNKRL